MRLEEAFAGQLDWDRLDSRGFGPLHWCASKGDRELFQKVLAYDVDINQPSSHTKSPPLHFAIERDDTFFTEALIAAGADVNAADWHQQTALHMAAEGGRLPHARLLVAAGASVKEFDHNKRSPLDLAFKEARIDMIDYLTEIPEARHRTWSRRLLRAAQFHQPDVVEWLLARGANPLTKNKYGQTAIDLAKIPPYEIELDDTTSEEIAELDGNMQAVISMLERAVDKSKSEQDVDLNT